MILYGGILRMLFLGGIFGCIPFGVSVKLFMQTCRSILLINPLFLASETVKFKRLYKLGPELGRGGFGAVYSGFRLKDNIPVAVKILPRENISSWGMVSIYA